MRSIIFILFIFIYTTCFGNEIDKLNTIQDVNNFLVKSVDKKFKNNLPLESDSKIVDTSKYGHNKFFKLDIDNNGLTDLIIYGYRNLLVVLDNGKNNYKVIYLDRGAFLLNRATLVSIDTEAHPYKIIIEQSEKPLNQFDTLIFKYNSFIEYNPKPLDVLVFEKIKFK